MKSSRIDIGSIRRGQVIEAAVAIIAERGLQNLSLSEIEKRAGMSRGQLTYYFPAKEDILLAVFDRLLEQMYQRVGNPEGEPCGRASGREFVEHLLERLIGRPPVSPEFQILQYAFLSQIGHRADFRRRLATLYEEWRGNLAGMLAEELARRPGAGVPPRALATVVQALLHGLAMQAAADPEAFEPGEVLELCRELLGTYLGADAPPAAKRKAVTGKPAPVNGSRRHRNGH